MSNLTHLKISDPVLTISMLNSCLCNFYALLDTGSPISFIKLSVFKTVFAQNVCISKSTSDMYTAVNNVPIQVLDMVRTSLRLELLPDLVINIDFRVIDNQSWPTDIILGRDFLVNNQVSLIFNPSDSKGKANLQLLSEPQRM